MKKFALLAILALSTTAFAGPKDLKTFKTLLKVGASTEQFMSQVHVALEDIECSYSMVSKKYSCNLTDSLANEEMGNKLELSGAKAKALFNLLEKSGAQGDSGMGKAYISAKEIRCSQAVAGVADGSAADRTSCTVTLE